jgi:hypothetical protein
MWLAVCSLSLMDLLMWLAACSPSLMDLLVLVLAGWL